MKRLAGLLMLWVVSGCAETVGPRLSELVTGAPLGRDEAQFSALVAQGAPRMALWTLDKPGGASLLGSGARQGVERWRSIDNVQLYLRDGVLVGTRGLGDDLMTVDEGGALALILSGRAGRVTRIERVLDGQERLKIRAYVCDITPRGPERVQTGETRFESLMRVDQQCYGPDRHLQLAYWLRFGRVVQQELWIGPVTGRIRLLTLTDTTARTP